MAEASPPSMQPDVAADADVGAALRGVLRLETVIDRLNQALTSAVPAAEGIVVAIEDEEATLRVIHSGGVTHGLTGAVLPTASLSRAAMTSRSVLHCDDATNDPRVFRPLMELIEMASLLSVPLLRAGASFGVVNLVARRPGAFDHADVATCTELAETLAPIITIYTEIMRLIRRLPGGSTEAAGADPASRLVAQVLRPELAVKVETRRRIAELLATEHFTVVYQPIVHLPNLELAAVEALARFPSPPSLPPDRWFADGESVGLGVQLELAAVAKAVEALDQLPPSVRLAVNVGPNVLAGSGLLRLLQGVDPARMVIELTEHAAVDDYAALQGARARLRQRGVRLAVDDTGAGFASLTHVANLEPDYIKLDRWIVAGIDQDPVRQALTGALAGFAHAIGAQVVGEGIETAAELDTLSGLGVDLGQGYFLAHPSTPADLTRPIPRPQGRAAG